MTKPFVTVLMSVYNGDKYLKESISSILDQSYENFEYLIIDDGSSDHSREIIESCPDRRIKLVRNAANIGLARSLNIGLEQANGKYIVRMDADDVSKKDRIYDQVRFMENNPDVGVCGSWVRPIGSSNGSVWKYPVSSDLIKCRLIFEPPFAHPATIIRRSILIDHNLRYDDELEAAQDYSFWVKMAEHTSMANLKKTLLYYRMHDQSVTARSKAQREISAQIRQRQLLRLGLNPSETELRIHNELSEWQFDRIAKEVTQTEKWLLKLRDSNELAGVFPEPEFSETLARRWFLLCYQLRLRPAFWKSPLAPLAGLSSVEVLKLFIKSTVSAP